MLFSTVQTVQEQVGQPFLYLLHFDEPRFHAQHYLGSSVDLLRRLQNHADGQAARLTQVLWEDGQHWQLAALFTPRSKDADIRALEQRAKSRHQARRFCPICNANYSSPPGTISYPIKQLSRRTTQSLRRKESE